MSRKSPSPWNDNAASAFKALSDSIASTGKATSKLANSTNSAVRELNELTELAERAEAARLWADSHVPRFLTGVGDWSIWERGIRPPVFIGDEVGMRSRHEESVLFLVEPDLHGNGTETVFGCFDGGLIDRHRLGFIVMDWGTKSIEVLYGEVWCQTTNVQNCSGDG